MSDAGCRLFGAGRVLGAALVLGAGLIAAPSTGDAALVGTGYTGAGEPFSTVQPSLALTPLLQVGGVFGDLGQVKWFAGNFAPGGFESADGRLLPISTNTALFAQLGTAYGGDGRSTFALPNLFGRAAVGAGGTLAKGEVVGESSIRLTEANLPPHGHSTATGPTRLTGGAQPFTNLQPGLALDYRINLNGNFPSHDGGGATPDQTLSFVRIDAGFHPWEYSPSADTHGQLLPINSNMQLWVLNGVTYGGDGVTTFALPDTRDRLVIGAGHGPGLDRRFLGDQMGSATSTLTGSEMPAHDHPDPDLGTPTGVTGAGMPLSNLQPEIVLNYLIAGYGVYPTSTHSAASLDIPFIGEIALFSGNFAPAGWWFADGSELPINDNGALFSILGTQYGGDGITTFALPDLEGPHPDRRLVAGAADR